MKNSVRIFLAVIFISQLTMGLQCDRAINSYRYNFLEKINLYPSQKSYKTGDTIWLESASRNNLLYDNITSSYITADTVSVHFQVSLISIYEGPVNPPDGFCDFVTLNGVNVGRDIINHVNRFVSAFGCNSNNNLNFLIGVVLKEKGIYSLELPDATNVGSCINRRSNFPVSSIDYTFNVADGNRDVYLSIPAGLRPVYSSDTERNIDNKRSYIIKVE